MSVLVFSSIGTSLWGVELHDIEKETLGIEAENRKITDEIVSKTSLTDIYERKDELGYKQAENIIYLNIDTAVAQVNIQ